jgi:hypothetical protein
MVRQLSALLAGEVSGGGAFGALPGCVASAIRRLSRWRTVTARYRPRAMTCRAMVRLTCRQDNGRVWLESMTQKLERLDALCVRPGHQPSPS